MNSKIKVKLFKDIIYFSLKTIYFLYLSPNIEFLLYSFRYFIIKFIKKLIIFNLKYIIFLIYLFYINYKFNIIKFSLVKSVGNEVHFTFKPYFLCFFYSNTETRRGFPWNFLCITKLQFQITNELFIKSKLKELKEQIRYESVVKKSVSADKGY